MWPLHNHSYCNISMKNGSNVIIWAINKFTQRKLKFSVIHVYLCILLDILYIEIWLTIQSQALYIYIHVYICVYIYMFMKLTWNWLTWRCWKITPVVIQVLKTIDKRDLSKGFQVTWQNSLFEMYRRLMTDFWGKA
jgi:hypothetical protein